MPFQVALRDIGVPNQNLSEPKDASVTMTDVFTPHNKLGTKNSSHLDSFVLVFIS
jgi:hypothetical protein